jgi:hypothetical protein
MAISSRLLVWTCEAGNALHWPPARLTTANIYIACTTPPAVLGHILFLLADLAPWPAFLITPSEIWYDPRGLGLQPLVLQRYIPPQ